MHLFQYVILSTFLLCSNLLIYSNENLKPEVGKRCPDFLLTDVTHYKKKQVTLDDFKGKWLFLDFWFTGCTACIASFTKISKLQEEFKENVQFLLVGKNDHYNRNAKALFESLREKRSLKIASAYDSVLGPSWDIHSMPFIIIVDPQGIVRHLATGSDFTSAKIKDLIDGKEIEFMGPSQKAVKYEPNKVRETNVISRSILSKWNGEQADPGYDLIIFDNSQLLDTSILPEGYQIVAMDLAGLYNRAYFGRHYMKTPADTSSYDKIWNRPILNIRDSTPFETDMIREVGKGYYNYQLNLPADRMNSKNIRECMQQDLKRIFDYKATIEERSMPILKLIAKPETKALIRTKGGEKYTSIINSGFVSGFTYKNHPFKHFFNAMLFYLYENQNPIVDDTGITENIDIVIDADLTNIYEVRKALDKYGMDLVTSTKTMKVLILKDQD